MHKVELPNRGTLAYEWTGTGPETAVLINGSVFNYHQWDKHALPILQRELAGQCRFLQYDYIGVGGSSAKNAPFNMFDLADELLALLDALSVDRVHLLGISKGSLVGQAFLIQHPQRALSFCGLGNPYLSDQAQGPAGSEFSDRLEALETCKELWPQRINPQNYKTVFDRVYVPAIFGKEVAGLSLIERLRAFAVRRMVYPALEGTYVQTMVDLFRYYVDGLSQEAPAFDAGLSRVKGIPILLLNGTADTTTPPHMSCELAELLPGAGNLLVSHCSIPFWIREMESRSPRFG